MDVESSDLLFQDEVPADKQYYRDIAFRCHFLAIALFKFCIPDEDFHPTFDPRFDWIEVKDWYENIPPSASTITGLPMIKWPDEILKQHKLRREGRRIVGEQEPQSS